MKMLQFGMEPIRSEDIINEIFDMVGCRKHDKMTLDELIRSGVGGTVVSILIDVNGFWVSKTASAIS
jgi:hypothetical protein